jgi:broad specificity phosphatase PhoE
MKVLEIRRHSLTKKGPDRGKGSHLSGAGVQLARRIGETIGPCDLVLTSFSPRTIETALAMGYAVDESLGALGEMPEAFVQDIGHHERWAWEEPFQVFAEVLARGGATAQVGHHLQEAWRAAAEAVSANGKGLLITHGRLLEVGVVACLPAAQVAAFGRPFGHCEGIQLGYEAGQFHLIHLLRLIPAERSAGED